MTQVELITNYKKDNPHLGYKKIAKALGTTRDIVRTAILYHKKGPLGKLLTRQEKNELKQKFGGVCVICGYDRYIGALEFHHKDASTKKFEISRAHTLASAEEEAQKCVLVCANCHREIHAGLIAINHL